MRGAGVKAEQAVIPGLAALVVALLLRAGSSVSLLAFLGAVLAVALCIWLVIGVMSAAARAHRLRIFRARSWLRLVAGGHLLRMAVALPVALWAALWIVVALVAQPGRTLAGAALVAVLVPLVGRLVARTIDREVIAEQRLRILLPPVIALVGAAVLVLSLLVPSAPPETFGEGVARAMRYTGTSALLGQLFDLHALSAGLIDLLRGAGWRAFLLGLVFEGSVWFGLASAFALLLVPPRAALRILQADGRPGALAFGLSGVVLAAVVLVVLEGAAALEAQARVVVAQDVTQLAGAGPRAPEAPALPAPDSAPEFAPLAGFLPSALRERVERERVDDMLCLPGTGEQLLAAQARIESLAAEHRLRVEVAARRGFDRMRDNVPVFLDAYYSLSAEYLRIWNLLAGSAEDHLQEMLGSHLEAGRPLEALKPLLADAGRELAPAIEAARALRERCSGALPRDDVEVIITDTLPTAGVSFPDPVTRASFQRDLVASGFIGLGGGVAGAVIGSIGVKLAVTPAFKAAATTLAKIAGGRLAAALAGAGAGAAGGGAAGSVVPGAGTAAGAAVGGVAAFVGTWVAADYVLLKLDERWSRPEFEAEILGAIDATEAEFLAALGVVQGQEPESGPEGEPEGAPAGQPGDEQQSERGHDQADEQD